MAAMTTTGLERRLFRLNVGLAVAGTLLTWVCFDKRAALSFVAGAVVAGLSNLWLRSTINAIFSGKLKGSQLPVLAGFLLRLMLIPLCLYVMIRFLFLVVLAAVAGFAVLVCSVLVEGVLEAFGSSPR